MSTPAKPTGRRKTAAPDTAAPAAIPAPAARLAAFLARLRGDVYPEEPSPAHDEVTAKVYARFKAAHPLPAGATVLDVGCGQGLALRLFARDGLVATGIALGEDVAVCRAAGHDVREMDLHYLDFPDASFDMVWCRHAIEHSIMPFFTLSEIFRVMKPGGVGYVEVPSPDTASGHENNPNHYSVLGHRMWLRLMQRSGFDQVVHFDVDFELAIGPDRYWGFMLRRAAA
ncbi:class I SAM-dependent methyltransferase [Siculibacillus lacustris]|nr:class I SAM-dependent methyltransferase [Siculibacillus lacustris]